MAEEGALVIYGRGADLGNFKFFADDLVTTELTAFKKEDIIIETVERRNGFFDYLKDTAFKFKIKEMHIYSHSYGGALSIGYKDPTIAKSRESFNDTARGGRTNYLNVLNNEVGHIFTDDLIRKPYIDYQTKIRTIFAPNAKIKIWGCNSGIVDWKYSDQDNAGNYVYDIDAPAAYYYWRAINEMNNPKPSIAQAFADYFQISTFGATSGSSIQVKYKGKWIGSPNYLKQTGRRYIVESDVMRLAPDVGDYNEYKPK
jgi:hypothetical protein